MITALLRRDVYITDYLSRPASTIQSQETNASSGKSQLASWTNALKYSLYSTAFLQADPLVFSRSSFHGVGGGVVVRRIIGRQSVSSCYTARVTQQYSYWDPVFCPSTVPYFEHAPFRSLIFS